ncbi:MAG: alpha-ketoglutarate-dependent dioxygenase AlkB [Acidimicrobiales bacterium]
MSTVASLPAAYVPASYQATLFGIDDPYVDTSLDGIRRTQLDETSWVDLLPRWMQGSDLLFGELVARLRWAQREVVMYDQMVLEPRLTAWWTTGSRSAEPAPVLGVARQALTEHYLKPFDSIGFNLYRDGRDSVAWHADRERFEHEDPVVVIVSLGSPRPFQIRPKGGGPSQSWLLGHGDLLVMGGACQHDWEHCVPKVAHAHGPRLSIMFRHHLAE